MSATQGESPPAMTLVMGNRTYEWLQAMIAAGEFPDTSDLMEFLEKPWHWNDEYAAWESFGRPNEEDQLNFKRFTDYLVERYGASG
jgi:hypothetical protein